MRRAVRHAGSTTGIQGVAPGPNLRTRASEHRVYPYLLRNLTAQRPNQVWGCDITYVRLRTGWRYLVAILDWYSRYVVRWMLDETLEIGFVLDAIAQARTVATPEIWNTDQGSHFTSPQVTEPLLAAGVQISMDGRGRAYDNILTEYGSPREARQGIGRYLPLYNTERPHQALDHRRPAEVYRW